MARVSIIDEARERLKQWISRGYPELTARNAQTTTLTAQPPAPRPGRHRLRLVASAGLPIKLRVPSATVVQATEDLIEARRAAGALWGKAHDLWNDPTTSPDLSRDLNGLVRDCRLLHEQLERMSVIWCAALTRAGIVPPVDQENAR
jgi:hypothetical protein